MTSVSDLVGLVIATLAGPLWLLTHSQLVRDSLHGTAIILIASPDSAEIDSDDARGFPIRSNRFLPVNFSIILVGGDVC